MRDGRPDVSDATNDHGASAHRVRGPCQATNSLNPPGCAAVRRPLITVGDFFIDVAKV
jgi:hypothetical protein